MADDIDSIEADGLDADTKAYFESGGEKIAPSLLGESAPAAPDKPADAVPADKAAQDAVEAREPTQVPLRALQEEREEKKALRDELRKLSEQHAVLADRWQTLLSMQEQQPKADEDPEPDPSKDIFAHNAWLGRQLAKERQTREERTKQEQEAQQAAIQEQQLWGFWQQDAANFRAKNQTEADVFDWASEYRDKQLQGMAALYPNLASKPGRDAQITTELRDIVVKAARLGISPAEAVHNLAKGWGYKGKAPDPDPAKVIADANKNADAEKSLSQLGGGATPGPKTVEDVAAMSPDDFEKWLTKNPNGFKRLFGG